MDYRQLQIGFNDSVAMNENCLQSLKRLTPNTSKNCSKYAPRQPRQIKLLTGEPMNEDLKRKIAENVDKKMQRMWAKRKPEQHESEMRLVKENLEKCQNEEQRQILQRFKGKYFEAKKVITSLREKLKAVEKKHRKPKKKEKMHSDDSDRSNSADIKCDTAEKYHSQ